MHLHLDGVTHALSGPSGVLGDPQDHVEGPPDRVEPRDAAGVPTKHSRTPAKKNPTIISATRLHRGVTTWATKTRAARGRRSVGEGPDGRPELLTGH